MEEYEELRGTEQRVNETDDRREVIKQKLRQYYDGRMVRKDLTKSMPHVDMDEMKNGRKAFTKEEWIDILLRSIL